MSKVCTNDVSDSTLDYTVSQESDIVSDSVPRSLSSCDLVIQMLKERQKEMMINPIIHIIHELRVPD